MEISCHKEGRQIKSITYKTKRNHRPGTPSNLGVINPQKLENWTVHKLEILEMLTGKKTQFNKILSLHFILAR